MVQRHHGVCKSRRTHVDFTGGCLSLQIVLFCISHSSWIICDVLLCVYPHPPLTLENAELPIQASCCIGLSTEWVQGK